MEGLRRTHVKREGLTFEVLGKITFKDPKKLHLRTPFFSYKRAAPPSSFFTPSPPSL